MKLKALIIDDEADNRELLGRLLSIYCPSIEVCGEAADANEAYARIIDHRPHVIFLDIHMPGNNGFSILKRFSEMPFEVVFVTSFDEYAIEAIRFNALDYLLKPIEVHELKETVSRLEKIIAAKINRQMQVVNLVLQLEQENPVKKLAVHHMDSVVLLSLSDITHLAANGNYSTITTLKGETFTSSKNLGEFEDMFGSYPKFVRVNKHCIVNLDHINDYSKGEPCMLTVNHKHSIEISRRKKKEVLTLMKSNNILSSDR